MTVFYCNHCKNISRNSCTRCRNCNCEDMKVITINIQNDKKGE